MIINTKLEEKDRGLVREVKIPKLQNKELAGQYEEASTLLSDADIHKNEAVAQERSFAVKCNKIAFLVQGFERDLGRVVKKRQRLEEIIAAIDPNDDLKKNELATYQARRASMIVDEENLKVELNETSEEWGKEKEAYDQALSQRQAAEQNYVKVTKIKEELLARGQKFAEEDYAHALGEIEKVRVELDYVKFRAIGQTDNEWIFLLLQPSEYEGDINIKETNEK